MIVSEENNCKHCRFLLKGNPPGASNKQKNVNRISE